MATANLGRVAIVPKGDWAAGTYKKLDMVRHAKATWMCVALTTTDEPDETSLDWMLTVEDGENGSSAFGGITGLPEDNDALKAALDKKLDLSALSAGLAFYQTTTNSSYGGGYKKLVIDTHDTDYDTVEQEITTTITGVGQLLASYISEPGEITGHLDNLSWTTVGRVRVTQGRCSVFFRIYKVAADNTETLLAESGESTEIRNDVYEEKHCTALIPHVDLISSDRIAIKFYGNKISAGAQSVMIMALGGTRPMRTYVPVPIGAVGRTSVMLEGDTEMYITESATYQITNYNSFSTYAVSVSDGTVSLNRDEITFTASNTAGTVTLTVEIDGVGVEFSILIKPASVLPPVITYPANNATNVGESPTFTTNPFAVIGLADTHKNSDWALWTGKGRTGSKLWESSGNSVNKTSITLPPGIVDTSKTCYLSVRHRGNILGVSPWTEHKYTTAATFNAFIPTPNPTPANYGAPFEGGFYAGIIWNQITQSTSSKTLATGTQTFTVPSMTAVPIVYVGQQLEVRSRANPDNKFIGAVTGATGTNLTINVTSIGGSGTFSDWSIMSRYRIIVPPKASGEHTGIALKNANTALPTACQTLTEGFASTQAMHVADSSTVYPAAHWARNLNIGGRTDWYIPARDELELCWRNLKPVTDNNYTPADRPVSVSFNYANIGSYGDTANTHGTNNNSSPTGAAYTDSVPAQTAATAFRTGGAEAFEFGSAYYWSSSNYNAANAWRQHWRSSRPGGQYYGGKAGAHSVRAVRRSII